MGLTESRRSNPTDGDGVRFATTHWSLVLAARGADSQSREAVETLCQTYWYPLYAYVRRRGYDAEQAQDLTQGFFARLLGKNDFADADQARGKFRSFLLSSLKHYLCNELDHARALKRGGGRTHISIDVDDAEARYRFEPSHEMTPERVFERRWALVMLERVLAAVREQYTRAGKEALFDALKGVLTCEPDAQSYRVIAGSLGMSEPAVTVAVHRLRKRYRDRLRKEASGGIGSEQEVDEEIRDLLHALSAR